MAKFELSDAVKLFTDGASAINNLWAVYVVATFAAAGYGVAASKPNIVQAIVVALGFSAFALGNWSLLRQSLTLNRALKGEILSVVASDPSNQFKASLAKLAATANPPWISLAFHIFIDGCVIIALLSDVV
jgi:hypothetical protein